MSVSQRFEFIASSAEQKERIHAVWDTLATAARVIEDMPMEPRCRALATTKLEEAAMWANKGIVFAKFHEGERIIEDIPQE